MHALLANHAVAQLPAEQSHVAQNRYAGCGSQADLLRHSVGNLDRASWGFSQHLSCSIAKLNSSGQGSVC